MQKVKVSENSEKVVDKSTQWVYYIGEGTNIPKHRKEVNTMTVLNYLETLPTTQIVTIYNDNHNIAYHGKAGYAPLTFDYVGLNSVTTSPEHPNEIIINA